MFSNLVLPKTHCLMGPLQSVSVEDVERVQELGFTHVKFKVGLELEKEAEVLNHIATLNSKLLFRLDFNETLLELEYQKWLSLLTENALSRIDFVEDPMPFDALKWSSFSRPALAVDRAAQNYRHDPSLGLVVVTKPALQSVDFASAFELHRIIFTSYMDHPVGEAFALLQAAQFFSQLAKPNEVYGLRTHHLFEESEYSEVIASSGSELIAPKGLGIGFDELLERENWQELE